jgi:hypothetical protein
MAGLASTREQDNSIRLPMIDECATMLPGEVNGGTKWPSSHT